MIGYLDKAIRAIVLIMPKMSGYVKTFKVKEGNNKLMPFWRWEAFDDEKLLKKYKATSTNIENLKNTKLPVCDDRHVKTKTRAFGDKVFNNFRGLNMPEDDIECESFTAVFIDSSNV